jgi:predicted Ser/Thr protein kinase
MGAVYLARDPAIGRRVAIKVLRTDDEDYRRRFRIEVNAAGALRHRHIVTIFDSGEHEGSPFLAMEFVPGETLAEKIARREILPLSEKLRFIIELCDGLAHAHRAGIVHRDVKPANVIIDNEDQSVKIVDFGIARVVGGGATTTQTGMMVGTPAYMAPEQILGQPVDHRCDVFATGCVLYELVAYEPAFPSKLGQGLMYYIVNVSPVDLSRLVPGIDPGIVAIVGRALHKDPKDRFAQIGEMSAALTTARDRLMEEDAAPSPKRRSATAVVGTLVVVLITVVAVWMASRGTEFDTDRGTAPVVTKPVTPPPTTGAQAASPPLTPPPAAVRPPETTAVPETRLRIDAPADAIVALDGASSAHDAVVRAGRHTLTIKRPGVIGTWEQTVTVAEGQSKTITPDLGAGTLLPAELPFPYESVTVDGRPVTGRTTALNGSLVAEFVPVTGSAAQRRRVSFRLRTGDQRELSALIPSGRLRFEVNPAAAVAIDAHTFGTTRAGSLPNIAIGNYTIRLARPDYPDFSADVRVTAGQEVLVRITWNSAARVWVRR